MNDISSTIVPKSDQLNSDDLITGPKTIRITQAVVVESVEQPVIVRFDGDNGRPWKPCKSMRRILATLWGTDSSKWSGQIVTLYRDDSVKWGGVEVGGIRVSYASGISSPLVLALTTSKSRRIPYTVHPLPFQSERAAINAAQTMESLKESWDKLTKEAKIALRPDLEAIKKHLQPAT